MIIYETSLDRKNEESIRLELERAWGVRLQKIEPTRNRNMRYKLDVMAIRNDIATAMIELKDRSGITSNQYKTINLSLEKFNKGLEYFLFNGLSFLFCVKFKDGLHYYKHDANDRWPVIWWGSDRRGDPNDWEPCVAIDSRRFKKI